MFSTPDFKVLENIPSSESSVAENVGILLVKSLVLPSVFVEKSGADVPVDEPGC